MQKDRNKNLSIFLFVFGMFLSLSQAVHAQYLVVGAEQVRERLTDGSKVMLIDTRTPDEYREGHIPKAVNIQPDNMQGNRKRLPKDKSTPIIFYCRGAG